MCTARLLLIARTSCLAWVVLLAGCNSGVQGTYVGVKGQSFFDHVELKGEGKVVVTLVGVAYDATYEVKGSTVVVNHGGQISELKVEQGCLVDPIGGRYCKGGETGAAGT
jgi:hypothetical protein